MEGKAPDIICDKCGATFGGEDVEIKERVVATDENGDAITEKFFECPVCGQHHTITVCNRRMRLKIQKRKQLRAKIASGHKFRVSVKQVGSWQKEDDRLKEELLEEARVLREKYLTEE